MTHIVAMLALLMGGDHQPKAKEVIRLELSVGAITVKFDRETEYLPQRSFQDAVGKIKSMTTDQAKLYIEELRVVAPGAKDEE